MRFIAIATCLAACLTIVPAVPTAHAQAGAIALFTDASGTDCNVTDNGAFSVFVLLIDHMGAFACDFALSSSAGMTAVWQSDTHVFVNTTGQSQSGLTIILGGCQPSPTHVLTVNYFGTGTSSTCSSITPVPNPNQAPPLLGIADCLGNRPSVPGELLRVNPDNFCRCTNILPVEAKSWGAIKNLYSGD